MLFFQFVLMPPTICLFQESFHALRTAMITDVPDLAQFFWGHLKKDLRIIAKCLSHGENEVHIVLHRVIHHLAGMEPTIGRCNIFNVYCGNVAHK